MNPNSQKNLSSLAGAAWRAGLLDPASLAALTAATALLGRSTATPYAAAAARYPNRTAIIDDYGCLTYRELDRRTTQLAVALRRNGIDRSMTIGVLCRNHRGFIEANVAAAKLGARTVLLNTGLPESQLTEVVDREEIAAVIADQDLSPAVEQAAADGCQLVICAPEADTEWSFPGLSRPLLPVLLRRPGGSADPVLLTSGTTGAPKGTRRSTSNPEAGVRTALSALGFVESIPFSRGDVTVLPAPLFHAWGFSQLVLSATLAGTVVLRRRFSPRTVLDDIEAHGGEVLAAVPVMLHRILETERALDVSDESSPEHRDLSTLRLVAVSGSALPGDLAVHWMDRFGDTLYNLYGSTEVGQVSAAGPGELRMAPGTAGRPLRGIEVQILDDLDQPVAPGETGHIAIGSPMHFDGYTDGQTKRVLDGRMFTGDQGHIDQDGLLFVDGRDDDMIITGGENVFPAAIEQQLLDHPAVGEAVVVGVMDQDLGQRIRAVVVPEPVQESVTAGALTKQLKRHLSVGLADYEVPREYVYVTALPRTTTGKVVRGELTGEKRSVPYQRTRARKAKAAAQATSTTTAANRRKNKKARS